MFHNGSITIETPRLILRKFTLNDVDTSFKNWTSDDKVTEFLRWQTHKDIKVTKSVIKKWIKYYKKPDFYQWAIVLKKSINLLAQLVVLVCAKRQTKYISVIVLVLNGGIKGL